MSSSSSNAPSVSPAETLFDWRIFFGPEGGQRFQRLCVDLLTAMHMTVRESARGGHDEGKDIIIFEYPDPSWLKPPRPTCFVECKSRQENAKALSKLDVAGVFLAILKHKLNRVLIMTNHEFNNELMNYLLDVNGNDHWGVKVTWMERAQLEDALLACPEICRKYFGDLDLTQRTDRSGSSSLHRLVAELKPLSPFAGPDNQLRLVVTNTFTESLDVTISSASAAEKRTMRLDPFEIRTLTLPMPVGETETWPRVELNGRTSSGREIVEECEIDGRPLLRVDHLYVDPFHYVDRLTAAIAEPGCYIVLGGPGAGKSRLLLEVSSRLQQAMQWIDLSEQSYAGSLSDHLLSAIFRLSRADLAELPGEVLERSLVIRGVSAGDASTLSELARRSARVDGYAAADTIAAVCRQVMAGQLVVIDNIHRIGPFDAHILQRMTAGSPTLRLVLSARANEISRAEVSAWIHSIAYARHESVVDLDRADRRALLQAFVSASAMDRKTAQFLGRFAGLPSLQQFVFTLKELKAHGFLKQDGQGRFTIVAPAGPVPVRTYEQLYLSLIAGADSRVDSEALRLALETAAIYGLTFPLEFIEEVVGSDGIAALDELVRLELVIPLPTRSGGGRALRFDHELTQGIVYKSVGLTRRNNLHQRVASFMVNPARFRPGLDSAALAHHLREIGAYKEAASRLHEAAVFVRGEGQLVESLELLRQAEAAAIEHHEERARHDLEVGILQDTFRLQQQLGASDEELRRTLAALDILVLLRSPYRDTSAEAGRLLGFRAEIEADAKAARKLAQTAVQVLEPLGSARDTGEALIRLGNLTKRDGDFVRAARLMSRASRLLRGPGFEDLHTTALLDFGAIFLEASRGRKVPLWWSRAVTIAARMRPLNVGVLAHALADEAYSFALFKPTDAQAPMKLERAYHLSQQRRLAETQCRAAINWANWCNFHLEDTAKALTLLYEAEKTARQQDLAYHLALVAFSRLNFAESAGSQATGDLRAQVRTFLLGSNRIKGAYSGDWRVRNMTALLLALGDNDVWRLARASDEVRWRPFFNVGLGAKLAELEMSNPYFISSKYATYY